MSKHPHHTEKRSKTGHPGSMTTNTRLTSRIISTPSDKMHSPITTTLLAITSLLTLTTSTLSQTQSQSQSSTPYFAVRNFTWSKTPTSSATPTNLLPTGHNNHHARLLPSTTTLIPGYTARSHAQGFYSGATGSNVTAINACGYIDGDEASPKNITTKLDVGTGELDMVYSYREVVEGGGGFRVLWEAEWVGACHGGRRRGDAPVEGWRLGIEVLSCL